ncbi:MAG: ankyrin repeat domain-containing protein [Gammaproteobacteria bacterium]|nr:ankyrin repeat domain-containing protein [Gammaproteobacteria bacterium]
MRDNYLAPAWDGDKLSFDVLLVGPTDCDELRKAVIVALHDRGAAHGSKVRYRLTKWEDLPLSASSAAQLDIERILAGHTFQIIVAVADQRVGDYSIREIEHFLGLPAPRPRVYLWGARHNRQDLDEDALDRRSAMVRYFKQVEQRHNGLVYRFDSQTDLENQLVKQAAGIEQDERSWHLMHAAAPDQPGVAAEPPDKPEPTKALDEFPVFVGLSPFGRKDAAHFFGRETEIAECLDVINSSANRSLLVKGGSGNGKSSLILAGVLPRLPGTPVRSPRNSLYFHPGADPFIELLAVLNKRRGLAKGWGPRALEAEAQRLCDSPDAFVQTLEDAIVSTGKRVLYIDQLEELLVETADANTDEGRHSKSRKRAFVAGLKRFLDHDEGRNFVLATIRSDYADKLVGESAADVHRLFERGPTRVLHAPEHDADIDRIVLGPCERAGFAVDPLLLKAVRADIRTLNGWPPLLSACLEEMVWAIQANPTAMEARRFTKEQYMALGGLRDVVKRRAEAFQTELSPEHARLLPKLFKRLVRIDREKILPTKARVTLSSLPPVLRNVAEEMRKPAHRLLADEDGDKGMVELIHDTLLERWPRLKTWIDGNSDSLLDQQDFEARAAIWCKLERDERKLARAGDLADDFGRLRTGTVWAMDAQSDVGDWVNASREDDFFELLVRVADPIVWRLSNLAAMGIRLSERRVADLPGEVAPFYFVLCPDRMPAPAPEDAQQTSSVGDAEDVRAQFAATQADASNTKRSPLAYLRTEHLSLRFGRTAQYELHHIAALCGHLDVLERLRELGADLNKPSTHNRTALSLAALNGHLTVVDHLLALAPDPARTVLTMAHETSRHAFHDAAFWGHADVLRRLLEAVPAGQEVDTADGEMWTPLLAAAHFGQIDFVRALIESGRARLDAQTGMGLSILSVAIQARRWRLVQQLLVWVPSAKLAIDQGDAQGNLLYAPLALLIDAWSGTLEDDHRADIEAIFRSLLEAGAEPRLLLGSQALPLVAFAAERGALPLLALLTPRTDAAAVDSTGQSALHLALRNRREDCALHLLALRVDDALPVSAGPALMLDAIRAGLFEPARILIQRDARQHARAIDLHRLLALLPDPAAVDAADLAADERQAQRDLALARGRIVAMLLDHGMPAPRVHRFARDPAERIIGSQAHLDAIGDWRWHDAEWPLDPLIDGQWQAVPAADCADILRQCVSQGALDALELEDLLDQCARRLPLGFYKDGALVEFAARGDEGGIVELLQVGKRWIRLQGTSPPLHQINAEAPLALRDDDDARTYLALFTSAVHGEEGAFRLLDRFDRVIWLADADPASMARVESLCMPVATLPRMEDGRFRFECRVLYSNAVFTASMAVASTGMAEMLEDIPLESDLRVAREKFVDGIRRVVGGPRRGPWPAPSELLERVKERLAALRCPVASWLLPPLTEGEWQEIHPADCRDWLAQCVVQGALVPDDLDLLQDQCGRCLVPTFYEDALLAEFAVRTARGPGTLALMRQGGVWRRFDGRRQALEWTNARASLRLPDAASAQRYLDLFCAVAQGPEGVFRLLRDESRVLWLDAAAPHPDLRQSIEPPRLLPIEAESPGHRFRCTILYGTHVFHTDMSVAPGGMVEMKDEVMVLTNLPIRVERFVDGVRIWTDPQAKAGDDPSEASSL